MPDLPPDRDAARAMLLTQWVAIAHDPKAAADVRMRCMENIAKAYGVFKAADEAAEKASDAADLSAASLLAPDIAQKIKGAGGLTGVSQNLKEPSAGRGGNVTPPVLDVAMTQGLTSPKTPASLSENPKKPHGRTDELPDFLT